MKPLTVVTSSGPMRVGRFSRRQVILICLVCLAAPLDFTSKAESAVLTVSGNVVQIAPPLSVVQDALESNTVVQLFAEQTAILLNQNISVDITQPGAVNNASNLTPGLIAANQLVDSYLLHSDAIGVGNPIVTFQGSVTFDQPILGIIVQYFKLDATDSILGWPTTQYFPTTPNRGFDGEGYYATAFAVRDTLQLSTDFRTISFVLRTASQSDQIRVVTASVPEPTTIALTGGCLALGLAWRGRRDS